VDADDGTGAPGGGALVLGLTSFWVGLYSDPCRGPDEVQPEIAVGPAVEDFIEAVVAHPALDVTTPEDVALGGFSGQFFSLTGPSDLSDCDSWRPWDPSFYARGPDNLSDVWVIDADGFRVLIVTEYFPGTPDQIKSELRAMAESIRFVSNPPLATEPPRPTATPPAAGAIPLLVDTDVAPDDLVAISFLLASPNVAVKAITVSGTGEAHCAGGVDVVLRLLERLNARSIDVACGRETPIAGDHAFPDAWRANADNGADLDLPPTARQPFAGTAVELIAGVAADTENLRVLTLGPLTNLADALDSHPELAQTLESVYVMGGALHVPGNVMFGGPPDNEVAEWNIYVDPTAAQMVIDSGILVRLVSLDGTNQVPVTREFAERFQAEATGPAAQVLAELFSEHSFMTDGTYFLWDSLAAALAADYPVGTFSPARVDVEETEGPAAGFTRPVEGEPNIEYLSAADRTAAEELLLDTMN
jgi:pyrimidine-specific ribonucleoside hydrolase